MNLAKELRPAASLFQSGVLLKSPRALLLYEDGDSRELLRAVLVGEGFEVEGAPLDPVTNATPAGYSLILFDIHSITARLLETISAWCDSAPDTTLIVAGGRTAQASRFAVLEVGVNAYLPKPLIVPELRARVRGALRRFRSQDSRLRCFSFGEATVDLAERTIRFAARNVRLTRTECEILAHLASHINQTVPSNEVVRTLWGTDPRKGVHSLRLFIQKLRSKLEPDPANPRYLVTDPGTGYRLQVRQEALS